MAALGTYLSKSLYAILPLLVIGFMAGLVHLLTIFIFLLIALLPMNKTERVVAVLLVFPPLLGLAFQIFGIGIPGTVLPVLYAIVVLRVELLNYLLEKKKALLYILVIVAVFFIYYYLTGQTEYSDKKIQELLITSVLYFIAFSILVSARHVDTRKIGLLFLIYALLLASVGVEMIGYQQFSGIFDFSSFRQSASAFQHIEIMSISYHSVGVPGMTGLAFFVSSKARMDKVGLSFLIGAFWLILMSGARQALVGAVFICLFKYWLMHKKFEVTDVVKIGVVLFAFIIILILLNIETINEVFSLQQSADNRLNRNYDYPLMLINSNWFSGIGFGNYYNSMTEEIYPHNIFLEIICEMGMGGFLLLLGVVCLFLYNSQLKIRYKLLCGSFAAIIYTPYLIRALISDSIGHNISVFILLFVMFSDDFNILTLIRYRIIQLRKCILLQNTRTVKEIV